MTSLPISLPEGFTTLISQGDHVSSDQVIARKEASKEEIVNILQSLNISRSKAKKVLKKAPGEQIHPGDIIAVKKNFFGKEKATLISHISGTILRYERDTGNLVVRTMQDASPLELISPVAGVVRLCNNKEIVIETEDAFITKGIALGNNGEGELFILKESFTDTGSENALYYLDSRAEGKIVLVSALSRDLIIKGESIGVAGFIGTVIQDRDIDYLSHREITIPVMAIDSNYISQIRRWEDKKILIITQNKAIILKK